MILYLVQLQNKNTHDIGTKFDSKSKEGNTRDIFQMDGNSKLQTVRNKIAQQGTAQHSSVNIHYRGEWKVLVRLPVIKICSIH